MPTDDDPAPKAPAPPTDAQSDGTDAAPESGGARPGSPTERGRSGWLWSGALVGAAAVTALIVFLVATHGGGSAPAGALLTPRVTISTPTPSPSASATMSPSSLPSATAAPTPTATTTPTLANTPTQQAQLIFPMSGTECGGDGSYTVCPVVPQLVDAANQWRANHAPTPPAPLCRCQLSYVTPTFTQDDTLIPSGYRGNPQVAAVDVRLFFGASYEDLIVLFTRQSDGTWLASNTYCDDPGNELTAQSPPPTVCTLHS